MKKIILLALIAICAATCAFAQRSLSVDTIFDGAFPRNNHATVLLLSGRDVDKYKLSKYVSVTLTDKPEQAKTIEAYLAKDAEKAVDSEVAYKKGQLFYAFYKLPRQKGLNRYLLYLNQHVAGGNKIILAYMKGIASIDDVKKMINK